MRVHGTRLNRPPNSYGRPRDEAMSYLRDLLSVASGGLVGFALRSIGGGGWILAVPLLIHVVGLASPYVAIGTSAVAVAATPRSTSLATRARTTEWRCATVLLPFRHHRSDGEGRAWKDDRREGAFAIRRTRVVIRLITPRATPADIAGAVIGGPLGIYLCKRHTCFYSASVVGSASTQPQRHCPGDLAPTPRTPPSCLQTECARMVSIHCLSVTRIAVLMVDANSQSYRREQAGRAHDYLCPDSRRLA
jgi:hypothetical protein